MKTIKELEKEIEESSTKNCLEYDDSNKWRPMICRFCRKNYTSRGVDKHLNQVHGITRFDFGIREAKLEQTKEIIKMINKFVKENIGYGGVQTANFEKLKSKINGNTKQS